MTNQINTMGAQGSAPQMVLGTPPAGGSALIPITIAQTIQNSGMPTFFAPFDLTSTTTRDFARVVTSCPSTIMFPMSKLCSDFVQFLTRLAESQQGPHTKIGLAFQKLLNEPTPLMDKDGIQLLRYILSNQSNTYMIRIAETSFIEIQIQPTCVDNKTVYGVRLNVSNNEIEFLTSKERFKYYVPLTKIPATRITKQQFRINEIRRQLADISFPALQNKLDVLFSTISRHKTVIDDPASFQNSYTVKIKSENEDNTPAESQSPVTRNRFYLQIRAYDAKGGNQTDFDFTDHGYPDKHGRSWFHAHSWTIAQSKFIERNLPIVSQEESSRLLEKTLTDNQLIEHPIDVRVRELCTRISSSTSAAATETADFQKRLVTILDTLEQAKAAASSSTPSPLETSADLGSMFPDENL